ncbi:MAG: hypothetical protein NTU86_06400 [Burkholderiales bacterium]|nr:hypothetical protein [Burkholderiales bacterium]
MDELKEQIAAVAARMVVEEGLEAGPAKRRALKEMGLSAHTALPNNALVEEQVALYIAEFCSDTQPAELQVLRRIALQWMERLAAFRPHLTGPVWHATATRMSDITLQLFCDDPKSAEIGLIDMGVRYEPHTVMGLQGEPVDALYVQVRCVELQAYVGLRLVVYDFDDLRGLPRSDALGRRPRGDLAAVRQLVHDPIP